MSEKIIKEQFETICDADGVLSICNEMINQINYVKSRIIDLQARQYYSQVVDPLKIEEIFLKLGKIDRIIAIINE